MRISPAPLGLIDQKDWKGRWTKQEKVTLTYGFNLTLLVAIDAFYHHTAMGCKSWRWRHTHTHQSWVRGYVSEYCQRALGQRTIGMSQEAFGTN